MGSKEIRSFRFFPSVGSLAEEQGGVANAGVDGKFKALRAFADAVAAAAALAAATPFILPLA